MHAFRTHIRIAAIITGGALVVAAAGDDLSFGPSTQPTTQPTTQPETQPTSAPSPEVDAILTRIEQRQVEDLRAVLRWEEWYALNPDEKTLRRGEILYKSDKPVAKFKVELKNRVVSGRGRDVDERYLFDGRWYVELNAEAKTVIRREVREPTDTSNPYRLGEGPFPVPFGQKKADILHEFEVKLVPPTAEDPPQCDHLDLTPLAGTQSDKRFSKVHFWVAQEGRLAGLPVKAKISKKDGAGRVDSHSVITFSDVHLNEGLSASDFEIQTPAGYAETVETLQLIEPPKPKEDTAAKD